MLIVHVDILKFVDESNPGWVECQLIDAMGQAHTFIEKVPVVTEEDLWHDSVYPRAGIMGCEVVRRWQDDQGRALCEINTSRPWDIESKDGGTSFVVLAAQLDEAPRGWS